MQITIFYRLLKKQKSTNNAKIAAIALCSLLIFSCKKTGTTNTTTPPTTTTVVKIPYGTIANSILQKDFSLYIDSKGTKWLGYTDGILRYDGTSWVQYDSGTIGTLLNKVIPETEDAQGNIYFISTDKFYGVYILKYSSGIWKSYTIPVPVKGLPKLFYNPADNLLYLWTTPDLGQFIYSFSPGADFSQASNVSTIFGEPYDRGYDFNDCAFANNNFYICGGNEITQVSTTGNMSRHTNAGTAGAFDTIVSSSANQLYISAGSFFDVTTLLSFNSAFLPIPSNSTTYMLHICVDNSNAIYAVESGGIADKLVNGKFQAITDDVQSAIVVDGNNVKWAATEDYLVKITQ